MVCTIVAVHCCKEELDIGKCKTKQQAYGKDYGSQAAMEERRIAFPRLCCLWRFQKLQGCWKGVLQLMLFLICEVRRKALDEICYTVKVKLAGENLALGV